MVVLIMMSIGNRIADLRKKHNLTQEELSKKIGISRAALSHYEKDRREPDAETMQKIADFFGVTLDYLLSGKYRPSPGLSQKDEKDIAKRLEQIRNDIEHADGLSFNGEPMSDEAKDSLMDAMEFIVRQAKKINKKYTPKKYRKEDNSGK